MEITTELADWINAHWKAELGAVDGKDIAFIAGLLDQAKPRQIVEIGCATGFSTRVMATLLQETGPSQIDSFDIEDRFYADRSKPVGYLLNDGTASHDDVTVNIWTKTTALDVAEKVGTVDFCFIDAAHKHPWPTIDTLAVLPLMKPGGIIVHHDLQMYRTGGGGNYATGPKVLCDQLGPDAIRSWQVGAVEGAEALKSRMVDDNIFAIRVPQDMTRLAYRLSSGFCIGWDATKDKKLGDAFSARFRKHLETSFRPTVAKAFETGLARYEGVLQSE